MNGYEFLVFWTLSVVLGFNVMGACYSWTNQRGSFDS